MVEVAYFLAPTVGPLSAEDAVWNEPLPLTPHDRDRRSAIEDASRFTYGDYFTAVHRCLERGHYAALVAAAEACTGQTLTPSEFRAVGIYLEKHGQFCHPARITLNVGARHLNFVANVAVTAAGRAILRRDHGNLGRLNRGYPYRFLPQVYFLDGIRPKHCQQRIELSVGEWLEGYHECHLSGEPAEMNGRLVVWDPVQGPRRLSTRQRCAFYRQAAKILTAYYDPETFEQIFSWHHAAGDFIVKITDRGVDTRLITVRRYAPLFENVPVKVETILNALLVFLIHLTVRMRLDRLDGVGRTAWARDDAVAASVRGFFDGLTLQADSGLVSRALPAACAHYLATATNDDVAGLTVDIVKHHYRDSAEGRLIQRHLKHHVAALMAAMSRMSQASTT